MRPFMKCAAVLSAASACLFVAAPAFAAKGEPVVLAKCDQSVGTVAVVEGDTQGWTKFGLGSPRDLLAALAQESGCFTMHNGATGMPANFLMNVIAGDQEEVDQGINTAKSAVAEGLIRSGAASSVLGRVPGAGALLGAFGGLGGKKKTVAAGIRMISPANGQTLVSGSGSVKKSTLTFGGVGGFNSGATSSGYANSGDGKMLTEAFIIAFNSVVAQRASLTSAISAAVAAPAPTLASTPVSAGTTASAAIDTKIYGSPAKTGAVVRALRAGTTVNRTGKREGLFVEVTDNFGTKGWVSVEDLQ